MLKSLIKHTLIPTCQCQTKGGQEHSTSRSERRDFYRKDVEAGKNII